MLDSQHMISLAIKLVVPECDILRRIKNRWVHLPSGRVYNVGFNDPKVSGKDDITGEPLSQRSDDQPEIVRRRLSEYAEKTSSVIAYYEERRILRQFTGSTTDELWPAISQCVREALER